MPEEMSDEDINKIAKKRAKKKKDFYYHLGVYVGVNSLIIGVWALTDVGPDIDYPWFIWSWIVWGIGILFHYLWVFIFDRKSDRAAIEKESE
jgi:hypothetical protein